jgi:lysine/ornithine N-monooxygenase
MEADRYCTAVFLEVSQAFVWHQGLLYKIKNSFSTDFYTVISSYLLHRIFKVKYGEVVI